MWLSTRRFSRCAPRFGWLTINRTNCKLLENVLRRSYTRAVYLYRKIINIGLTSNFAATDLYLPPRVYRAFAIIVD